ncbi:hypothetical protein OG234_13125 [Streptomyces sp. NBC_01420]|uniref:hypothetical protein n=1 Tax=Streptomyces sp. NBC_01420 TaxID=2903858 RepID=UPI00324E9D97
MSADWYMEYGGVEIVNHSRLDAYLQTVGSPLDTNGACGCPTFGPEILDQFPYTTPDDEDNPAPWYDPDVPESTEFAGVMVLEVAGMDDHPVQRTVTGGIAGGGAIGPARALPRTITVTAVLLGSTCCGVEYGLQFLTQALQGCQAGDCDGDCLTVYSCCPGELSPEEFNARHRRTLRRVALTDGPRVTARAGTGCSTGTCQSGADIVTVEWVMTAAVPWLWTDPLPVMEVIPPVNLDGGCVEWCLHPAGQDCPGGCKFAACVDPTAACADTRCMPEAPPLPGAPLATCFCVPLATERACYEMDLTGRPNWSTDLPVITVRSGSAELRNLTISIFESGEAGVSCEENADFNRCSPHSYWHITYVPAGGAVTLDGQTGRATVECGGTCESSPDVYGVDGMPAVYQPLDCASYCVCLETDVENPPALDAVVTLNVTGRGR